MVVVGLRRTRAFTVDACAEWACCVVLLLGCGLEQRDFFFENVGDLNIALTC